MFLSNWLARLSQTGAGRLPSRDCAVACLKSLPDCEAVLLDEDEDGDGVREGDVGWDDGGPPQDPCPGKDRCSPSNSLPSSVILIPSSFSGTFLPSWMVPLLHDVPEFPGRLWLLPVCSFLLLFE